MTDIEYHFPKDFLWGTATAAHQVEGDNFNNDWWQWEQAGGGHICNDFTSGKACDWWGGRAEEDIARMADLHTNTHRLSLEWSRIEPQPGQWSEPALARYRQILTAMQRAGIKPMITLHHFTNPVWMNERGGWLNHDSVAWFAAFVEKVVREFGDLCDLWCTLNEPNVYATQSFIKNDFIGGAKPGPVVFFHLLEHLTRAHAAAFHVIHRLQPQAQVGLAMHLVDWHPGHPLNPFDRLLNRILDYSFNGVMLHALKTGEWRPVFGRWQALPEAKNSLDWVGVNYYQRYDVRLSLRSLFKRGTPFGGRLGLEKGPDWWGELWPYGLMTLLKRIYAQFGLPIYITENGVPDPDDEHRPHFILDHLRRVWQALRMGIPVRGYYFWSLVDNFEWAEGYNPAFHFGLYAVNFETQERTPRNSARLYAEIAASGKITSDMARRYAPEALDIILPLQGPGTQQVIEHLTHPRAR